MGFVGTWCANCGDPIFVEEIRLCAQCALMFRTFHELWPESDQETDAEFTERLQKQGRE